MAEPYILTVDIGNTSISYGLFRNGHVTRAGYLRCSPRPSREKLEKLITVLCRGRDIQAAAVSSVLPALNARWMGAVRGVLGIETLLLDHECDYGIKITYPQPQTLGTDRLVNACWASHRYSTPIIIGDFGTATTIDLVLPDEGYVGGVIAPGMELMLDYMEERTALLPKVKMRTIRRAVGHSTEEAMQIGARWGFIGMARELITRMQQTMGKKKCDICLTGGYAGAVSAGLGIPVIIDRHLTLSGIGRACQLNENR
jgi:type III pantothenate kinase